MKKIPAFLVFTALSLWGYSQNTGSSSQFMRFSPAVTVNVRELKNDFFPQLSLIEAPVPGQGYQKTELERIKSAIGPKIKGYSSELPSRNTVEEPILYNGFEGNRFSGHVPNDNDIAVSNEGKIVTVTNSTIYFFSEDSMLAPVVSLDNFVSAFGRPEGKYDPRVLYDPDYDRFILVFLNGFNDSTSFFFIAFSETNDPAGNWNIYIMPGNPVKDTSWTDFPVIAITHDELFVTFNLLKNDEHWKTGFKQSIIWQIDKSDGYAGDSLSTRLWTNIEFEGRNIRNLCPVQGGSFPAGPNMYFISNKNFSPECDSFFVLEITGKLDNPSTRLNIEYVKSDKSYGVPPYADQPFGRKFETNDARPLDAYFENGKIHFVGNTINLDNNRATIYHGVVSGLSGTKSISLDIINDPVLEFGYPSIVYTGNGTSNEAIMLFDHTSDSINPGVSALFYQEGNFSPVKRIKEGDTWVRVQAGVYQRWGDYTGLQRVYNQNGTVWGAGYYGKYKSSTERLNGTWVAKMKSPAFSEIEQADMNFSSANLFPNPVNDMFTLEFIAAKTSVYEFRLYSASGTLIRILEKNLVREGNNIFNFSLDPLPPGNYILRCSGSMGDIITLKVIR